jgi:hypothetical protein
MIALPITDRDGKDGVMLFITPDMIAKLQAGQALESRCRTLDEMIGLRTIVSSATPRPTSTRRARRRRSRATRLSSASRL